jgi:uncharacterized protein YegL
MKMKNKITELVFILDKSGSMSGLESDTIGGYNAMLKKQQEEPGEAIVTTVLFDDNYELLHDRTNIKGIKSITEKEYYVGGLTALLDAIGKTISKIVNATRHTAKEHQAEKVIFVITTDGMENASREYDHHKVKEMIEHQKARYNWEFIFLGANIDAVSTARDIGISEDRAVKYHADGEGTILNYNVVSEAIINLRANKEVDATWKEAIEKDYESRESKR